MIRKALVVGLGSIGERHLRILRDRLPDAEILVLRSSSCNGMEGCTTSLEEALEFRPQIAVIASPSTFHMDTAAPLIRAGCPVLIEKPIAAESDGVEEILAAARANGVLVAIGYNMRFLDTLIKFREEVQSNRIGRIISVRSEVGQFLPDWRPARNWRETVSARTELGGGVLREMSHEIDYLRWIFGDVDWVRAWTGRHGFQLAVEDTAHLLLGFKHVSSDSLALPPVATLTLDFVRRDRARSCVAIGERGTLLADFVNLDIRLRSGGQNEEVLFREERIGGDATYRAQLNAFLSSMSNGEEPPVTAEEGLAVLRIIEAAERSQHHEGIAEKVAT